MKDGDAVFDTSSPEGELRRNLTCPTVDEDPPFSIEEKGATVDITPPPASCSPPASRFPQDQELSSSSSVLEREGQDSPKDLNQEIFSTVGSPSQEDPQGTDIAGSTLEQTNQPDSLEGPSSLNCENRSESEGVSSACDKKPGLDDEKVSEWLVTTQETDIASVMSCQSPPSQVLKVGNSSIPSPTSSVRQNGQPTHLETSSVYQRTSGQDLSAEEGSPFASPFHPLSKVGMERGQPALASASRSRETSACDTVGKLSSSPESQVLPCAGKTSSTARSSAVISQETQVPDSLCRDTIPSIDPPASGAPSPSDVAEKGGSEAVEGGHALSGPREETQSGGSFNEGVGVAARERLRVKSRVQRKRRFNEDSGSTDKGDDEGGEMSEDQSGEGGVESIEPKVASSVAQERLTESVKEHLEPNKRMRGEAERDSERNESRRASEEVRDTEEDGTVHDTKELSSSSPANVVVRSSNLELPSKETSKNSLSSKMNFGPSSSSFRSSDLDPSCRNLSCPAQSPDSSPQGVSPSSVSTFSPLSASVSCDSSSPLPDSSSSFCLASPSSSSPKGMVPPCSLVSLGVSEGKSKSSSSHTSSPSPSIPSSDGQVSPLSGSPCVSSASVPSSSETSSPCSNAVPQPSQTVPGCTGFSESLSSLKGSSQFSTQQPQGATSSTCTQPPCHLSSPKAKSLLSSVPETPVAGILQKAATGGGSTISALAAGVPTKCMDTPHHSLTPSLKTVEGRINPQLPSISSSRPSKSLGRQVANLFADSVFCSDVCCKLWFTVPRMYAQPLLSFLTGCISEAVGGPERVALNGHIPQDVLFPLTSHGASSGKTCISNHKSFWPFPPTLVKFFPEMKIWAGAQCMGDTVTQNSAQLHWGLNLAPGAKAESVNCAGEDFVYFCNKCGDALHCGGDLVDPLGLTLNRVRKKYRSLKYQRVMRRRSQKREKRRGGGSGSCADDELQGLTGCWGYHKRVTGVTPLTAHRFHLTSTTYARDRTPQGRPETDVGTPDWPSTATRRPEQGELAPDHVPEREKDSDIPADMSSSTGSSRGTSQARVNARGRGGLPRRRDEQADSFVESNPRSSRGRGEKGTSDDQSDDEEGMLKQKSHDACESRENDRRERRKKQNGQSNLRGGKEREDTPRVTADLVSTISDLKTEVIRDVEMFSLSNPAAVGCSASTAVSGVSSKGKDVESSSSQEGKTEAFASLSAIKSEADFGIPGYGRPFSWRELFSRYSIDISKELEETWGSFLWLPRVQYHRPRSLFESINYPPGSVVPPHVSEASIKLAARGRMMMTVAQEMERRNNLNGEGKESSQMFSHDRAERAPAHLVERQHLNVSGDCTVAECASQQAKCCDGESVGFHMRAHEENEKGGAGGGGHEDPVSKEEKGEVQVKEGNETRKTSSGVEKTTRRTADGNEDDGKGRIVSGDRGTRTGLEKDSQGACVGSNYNNDEKREGCIGEKMDDTLSEREVQKDGSGGADAIREKDGEEGNVSGEASIEKRGMWRMGDYQEKEKKSPSFFSSDSSSCAATELMDEDEEIAREEKDEASSVSKFLKNNLGDADGETLKEGSTRTKRRGKRGTKQKASEGKDGRKAKGGRGSKKSSSSSSSRSDSTLRSVSGVVRGRDREGDSDKSALMMDPPSQEKKKRDSSSTSVSTSSRSRASCQSSSSFFSSSSGSSSSSLGFSSDSSFSSSTSPSESESRGGSRPRNVQVVSQPPAETPSLSTLETDSSLNRHPPSSDPPCDVSVSSSSSSSFSSAFLSQSSSATCTARAASPLLPSEKVTASVTQCSSPRRLSQHSARQKSQLTEIRTLPSSPSSRSVSGVPSASSCPLPPACPANVSPTAGGSLETTPPAPARRQSVSCTTGKSCPAPVTADHQQRGLPSIGRPLCNDSGGCAGGTGEGRICLQRGGVEAEIQKRMRNKVETKEEKRTDMHCFGEAENSVCVEEGEDDIDKLKSRFPWMFDPEANCIRIQRDIDPSALVSSHACNTVDTPWVITEGDSSSASVENGSAKRNSKQRVEEEDVAEEPTDERKQYKEETEISAKRRRRALEQRVAVSVEEKEVEEEEEEAVKIFEGTERVHKQGDVEEMEKRSSSVDEKDTQKASSAKGGQHIPRTSIGSQPDHVPVFLKRRQLCRKKKKVQYSPPVITMAKLSKLQAKLKKKPGEVAHSGSPRGGLKKTKAGGVEEKDHCRRITAATPQATAGVLGGGEKETLKGEGEMTSSSSPQSRQSGKAVTAVPTASVRHREHGSRVSSPERRKDRSSSVFKRKREEHKGTTKGDIADIPCRVVRNGERMGGKKAAPFAGIGSRTNSDVTQEKGREGNRRQLSADDLLNSASEALAQRKRESESSVEGGFSTVEYWRTVNGRRVRCTRRGKGMTSGVGRGRTRGGRGRGGRGRGESYEDSSSLQRHISEMSGLSPRSSSNMSTTCFLRTASSSLQSVKKEQDLESSEDESSSSSSTVSTHSDYLSSSGEAVATLECQRFWPVLGSYSMCKHFSTISRNLLRRIQSSGSPPDKRGGIKVEPKRKRSPAHQKDEEVEEADRRSDPADESGGRGGTKDPEENLNEESWTVSGGVTGCCPNNRRQPQASDTSSTSGSSRSIERSRSDVALPIPQHSGQGTGEKAEDEGGEMREEIHAGLSGKDKSSNKGDSIAQSTERNDSNVEEERMFVDSSRSTIPHDDQATGENRDGDKAQSAGDREVGERDRLALQDEDNTREGQGVGSAKDRPETETKKENDEEDRQVVLLGFVLEVFHMPLVTQGDLEDLLQLLQEEVTYRCRRISNNGKTKGPRRSLVSACDDVSSLARPPSWADVPLAGSLKGVKRLYSESMEKTTIASRVYSADRNTSISHALQGSGHTGGSTTSLTRMSSREGRVQQEPPYDCLTTAAGASMCGAGNSDERHPATKEVPLENGDSQLAEVASLKGRAKTTVCGTTSPPGGKSGEEKEGEGEEEAEEDLDLWEVSPVQRGIPPLLVAPPPVRQAVAEYRQNKKIRRQRDVKRADVCGVSSSGERVKETKEKGDSVGTKKEISQQREEDGENREPGKQSSENSMREESVCWTPVSGEFHLKAKVSMKAKIIKTDAHKVLIRDRKKIRLIEDSLEKKVMRAERSRLPPGTSVGGEVARKAGRTVRGGETASECAGKRLTDGSPCSRQSPAHESSVGAGEREQEGDSPGGLKVSGGDGGSKNTSIKAGTCEVNCFSNKPKVAVAAGEGRGGHKGEGLRADGASTAGLLASAGRHPDHQSARGAGHDGGGGVSSESSHSLASSSNPTRKSTFLDSLLLGDPSRFEDDSFLLCPSRSLQRNSSSDRQETTSGPSNRESHTGYDSHLNRSSPTEDSVSMTRDTTTTKDTKPFFFDASLASLLDSFSAVQERPRWPPHSNDRYHSSSPMRGRDRETGWGNQPSFSKRARGTGWRNQFAPTEKEEERGWRSQCAPMERTRERDWKNGSPLVKERDKETSWRNSGIPLMERETDWRSTKFSLMERQTERGWKNPPDVGQQSFTMAQEKETCWKNQSEFVQQAQAMMPPLRHRQSSSPPHFNPAPVPLPLPPPPPPSCLLPSSCSESPSPAPSTTSVSPSMANSSTLPTTSGPSACDTRCQVDSRFAAAAPHNYGETRSMEVRQDSSRFSSSKYGYSSPLSDSRDAPPRPPFRSTRGGGYNRSFSENGGGSFSHGRSSFSSRWGEGNRSYGQNFEGGRDQKNFYGQGSDGMGRDQGRPGFTPSWGGGEWKPREGEYPRGESFDRPCGYVSRPRRCVDSAPSYDCFDSDDPFADPPTEAHSTADAASGQQQSNETPQDESPASQAPPCSGDGGSQGGAAAGPRRDEPGSHDGEAGEKTPDPEMSWEELERERYKAIFSPHGRRGQFSRFASSSWSSKITARGKPPSSPLQQQERRDSGGVNTSSSSSASRSSSSSSASASRVNKPCSSSSSDSSSATIPLSSSSPSTHKPRQWSSSPPGRGNDTPTRTDLSRLAGTEQGRAEVSITISSSLSESSEYPLAICSPPSRGEPHSSGVTSQPVSSSSVVVSQSNGAGGESHEKVNQASHFASSAGAEALRKRSAEDTQRLLDDVSSSLLLGKQVEQHQERDGSPSILLSQSGSSQSCADGPMYRPNVENSSPSSLGSSSAVVSMKGHSAAHPDGGAVATRSGVERDDRTKRTHSSSQCIISTENLGRKQPDKRLPGLSVGSHGDRGRVPSFSDQSGISAPSLTTTQVLPPEKGSSSSSSVPVQRVTGGKTTPEAVPRSLPPSELCLRASRREEERDLTKQKRRNDQGEIAVSLPRSSGESRKALEEKELQDEEICPSTLMIRKSCSLSTSASSLSGSFSAPSVPACSRSLDTEDEKQSNMSNPKDEEGGEKKTSVDSSNRSPPNSKNEEILSIIGELARDFLKLFPPLIDGLKTFSDLLFSPANIVQSSIDSLIELALKVTDKEAEGEAFKPNFLNRLMSSLRPSHPSSSTEGRRGEGLFEGRVGHSNNTIVGHSEQDCEGDLVMTTVKEVLSSSSLGISEEEKTMVYAFCNYLKDGHQFIADFSRVVDSVVTPLSTGREEEDEEGQQPVADANRAIQAARAETPHLLKSMIQLQGKVTHIQRKASLYLRKAREGRKKQQQQQQQAEQDERMMSSLSCISLLFPPPDDEAVGSKNVSSESQQSRHTGQKDGATRGGVAGRQEIDGRMAHVRAARGGECDEQQEEVEREAPKVTKPILRDEEIHMQACPPSPDLNEEVEERDRREGANPPENGGEDEEATERDEDVMPQDGSSFEQAAFGDEEYLRGIAVATSHDGGGAGDGGVESMEDDSPPVWETFASLHHPSLVLSLAEDSTCKETYSNPLPESPVVETSVAPSSSPATAVVPAEGPMESVEEDSRVGVILEKDGASERTPVADKKGDAIISIPSEDTSSASSAGSSLTSSPDRPPHPSVGEAAPAAGTSSTVIETARKERRRSSTSSLHRDPEGRKETTKQHDREVISLEGDSRPSSLEGEEADDESVGDGHGFWNDGGRTQTPSRRLRRESESSPDRKKKNTTLQRRQHRCVNKRVSCIQEKARGTAGGGTGARGRGCHRGRSPNRNRSKKNPVSGNKERAVDQKESRETRYRRRVERSLLEQRKAAKEETDDSDDQEETLIISMAKRRGSGGGCAVRRAAGKDDRKKCLHGTPKSSNSTQQTSSAVARGAKPSRTSTGSPDPRSRRASTRDGGESRETVEEVQTKNEKVQGEGGTTRESGVISRSGKGKGRQCVSRKQDDEAGEKRASSRCGTSRRTTSRKNRRGGKGGAGQREEEMWTKKTDDSDEGRQFVSLKREVNVQPQEGDEECNAIAGEPNSACLLDADDDDDDVVELVPPKSRLEEEECVEAHTEHDSLAGGTRERGRGRERSAKEGRGKRGGRNSRIRRRKEVICLTSPEEGKDDQGGPEEEEMNKKGNRETTVGQGNRMKGKQTREEDLSDEEEEELLRKKTKEVEVKVWKQEGVEKDGRRVREISHDKPHGGESQENMKNSPRSSSGEISEVRERQEEERRKKNEEEEMSAVIKAAANTTSLNGREQDTQGEGREALKGKDEKKDAQSDVSGDEEELEKAEEANVNEERKSEVSRGKWTEASQFSGTQQDTEVSLPVGGQEEGEHRSDEEVENETDDNKTCDAAEVTGVDPSSSRHEQESENLLGDGRRKVGQSETEEGKGGQRSRNELGGSEEGAEVGRVPAQTASHDETGRMKRAETAGELKDEEVLGTRGSVFSIVTNEERPHGDEKGNVVDDSGTGKVVDQGENERKQSGNKNKETMEGNKRGENQGSLRRSTKAMNPVDSEDSKDDERGEKLRELQEGEETPCQESTKEAARGGERAHEDDEKRDRQGAQESLDKKLTREDNSSSSCPNNETSRGDDHSENDTTTSSAMAGSISTGARERKLSSASVVTANGSLTVGKDSVGRDGGIASTCSEREVSCFSIERGGDSFSSSVPGPRQRAPMCTSSLPSHDSAQTRLDERGTPLLSVHTAEEGRQDMNLHSSSNEVSGGGSSEDSSHPVNDDDTGGQRSDKPMRDGEEQQIDEMMKDTVERKETSTTCLNVQTSSAVAFSSSFASSSTSPSTSEKPPGHLSSSGQVKRSVEDFTRGEAASREPAEDYDDADEGCYTPSQRKRPNRRIESDGEDNASTGDAVKDRGIDRTHNSQDRSARQQQSVGENRRGSGGIALPTAERSREGEKKEDEKEEEGKKSRKRKRLQKDRDDDDHRDVMEDSLPEVARPTEEHPVAKNRKLRDTHREGQTEVVVGERSHISSTLTSEMTSEGRTSASSSSSRGRRKLREIRREKKKRGEPAVGDGVAVKREKDRPTVQKNAGMRERKKRTMGGETEEEEDEEEEWTKEDISREYADDLRKRVSLVLEDLWSWSSEKTKNWSAELDQKPYEREAVRKALRDGFIPYIHTHLASTTAREPLLKHLDMSVPGRKNVPFWGFDAENLAALSSGIGTGYLYYTVFPGSVFPIHCEQGGLGAFNAIVGVLRDHLANMLDVSDEDGDEKDDELLGQGGSEANDKETFWKEEVGIQKKKDENREAVDSGVTDVFKKTASWGPDLSSNNPEDSNGRQDVSCNDDTLLPAGYGGCQSRDDPRGAWSGTVKEASAGGGNVLSTMTVLQQEPSRQDRLLGSQESSRANETRSLLSCPPAKRISGQEGVRLAMLSVSGPGSGMTPSRGRRENERTVADGVSPTRRSGEMGDGSVFEQSERRAALLQGPRDDFHREGSGFHVFPCRRPSQGTDTPCPSSGPVVPVRQGVSLFSRRESEERNRMPANKSFQGTVRPKEPVVSVNLREKYNVSKPDFIRTRKNSLPEAVYQAARKSQKQSSEKEEGELSED